MAVRSILRMTKCYLKTPVVSSSFCRRLLATEGECQRTAKFRVDVGAHLQAPHGKEVCEDAYFVWDKHNVVAFGVADGVSSWRDAGVDASLFPNILLVNCIKYLEQSQGKVQPEKFLSLAYKDILENNQVEAGSSTVCVGVLDKESGHLQTATLGDSGFCILRNGGTFFKSEEQYHAKNVPFQVGVKEIRAGESVPHGNSPSDAETRHFNLEHDDLLIIGTDGLFDNLFPKDILDIMKPHLPEESLDYKAFSKELTKTALSRSLEIKPESGRKPEYQEKTHDIGQRVDELFPHAMTSVHGDQIFDALKHWPLKSLSNN